MTRAHPAPSTFPGTVVLAIVASVAAALAGGCGGSSAPTASRSSAPPGPSASAPTLRSNVTAEDYAGSSACAGCHPSESATFMRSHMHGMTRDATKVAPLGPFDGRAFDFKGDRAVLSRDGAERFVDLDSGKNGRGVYRITKIIGGHYREDYAGVLVESARRGAKVLGDPREELVMPVTWLLGEQRLRYKGYSVMVKERSGLRAGPVWNQTCIFCHNTPPHLDTMLSALTPERTPPYQGEVVDALLPRARRADVRVTDAAALTRALSKELARIGRTGPGPTLAVAIDTTRSAFREEHLMELGIGCEACHLGSADHVRDPRVLPSFEPVSPFLSVTFPKLDGRGGALEPAERRAAGINRACAKCHQVLFSGYEPTWEGGSRHGNAGGSNINSGEARDLLLGACASRLSCTDCHDPHAADATQSLRARVGFEQDRMCTKCHERYAQPDALRAHAHHEPSGAGARCLACHMPAKNLSLDGTLSRYHRIGSPNDPARVTLDRPMECALCHADARVDVLLDTMTTWWKKPFDRDGVARLYGGGSANVLLETVKRGKPHEQAVAMHVLGEHRVQAAVPELAAQLTHAYPIVRGYAKRGLEEILGSKAPPSLDLDGSGAAIDAAARSWLGARTSANPSVKPAGGAPVLP